MPDRMTLDEAREDVSVAIKTLDNLALGHNLDDVLALLDHLAARVEAGEAMAEELGLYFAAMPEEMQTPKMWQRHKPLGAAHARWEGLSK